MRLRGSKEAFATATKVTTGRAFTGLDFCTTGGNGFCGLAFSWRRSKWTTPADSDLCVRGSAAFVVSSANLGPPKLVCCRDNGAVPDNKEGGTLARAPIGTVMPDTVPSAKEAVLLGGGAIGGELACLFIYA